MLDSQFKNVRVYDNDGKTFDRYTAIFLNKKTRGPFDALGMSANPFHPQGFGQHTVAVCGKHLGKRIDSACLPDDCLKLIKQNLVK